MDLALAVRRLAQLLPRRGGGDAGFAATGRAYARFAIANPALFRLIFASPALSHGQATVRDSEAGSLLQANAAAAAAEEGGEAGMLAMQSWALVHGLAMLMLDGQIPADDRLIDRAIG